MYLKIYNVEKEQVDNIYQGLNKLRLLRLKETLDSILCVLTKYL